MRQIDRKTYTALGISEYALMCRAGEAAFHLLVTHCRPSAGAAVHTRGVQHPTA